MNVANQIGLAVLLAALPHGAHADHNHGAGSATERVSSSFEVGAQLVAARFTTRTFLGHYQGLIPSLQWSRGRFGVSANLGFYRLTENGRLLHGIGDVVLAGRVTLLGSSASQLGLSSAVSLPTGGRSVGLGMGHVMVMSAVWGR